jgi:hypothetical protein
VEIHGQEILAIDISFILYILLIYGLFITCGKEVARDRGKL